MFLSMPQINMKRFSKSKSLNIEDSKEDHAHFYFVSLTLQNFITTVIHFFWAQICDILLKVWSKLYRQLVRNWKIKYSILKSVLLWLGIQCWFKLSGQNEQNLNFQTRFSQIGLRLDKKWRGQKLLRILPKLIWCHFFSKVLNKNFTQSSD